MTDIARQLSELNKMSKRSVALYHRYALSIGVSDSALGVLYALIGEETPSTQYGLCSEWSIPKQTINTAVSALQKGGLVSLSPFPGTRNKKSIALTAAGREFVQGTVAALRAAELEALGRLTPEEREEYVRLNGKYNEYLAGGLERILEERDGSGNDDAD